MSEPSDIPKIEVGDLVTIAGFSSRRKWWEIWKPKWSDPVTKSFRIVAVASGGDEAHKGKSRVKDPAPPKC